MLFCHIFDHVNPAKLASLANFDLEFQVFEELDPISNLSLENSLISKPGVRGSLNLILDKKSFMASAGTVEDSDNSFSVAVYSQVSFLTACNVVERS